MCIENENANLIRKFSPKVFVKSIKFNDDTRLSLSNNSIIVFTGSNNSGKSQVLKEINNSLNKNIRSSNIIIKNFEFNFLGDIDEEFFLRKHFSTNSQGSFHLLGSNYGFDRGALVNAWKTENLHNDLHKLFIKRLSTELRLTVSNDLQRNNNAEYHPIYKLYNDHDLANKISNYFHQAFREDLVLNFKDLKTIPLHIGKGPEKKNYTIDIIDDYCNKITEMPKLQEQGDGMRSFVSILLDTFTSDYPITLIDEPEAFLHPPQARILGKMLAQNNPNNRQLFIATHSEDFLQGLLDSDNENVTIIRINRINNINKMSILTNDEIKNLWGNPLLRYSNILSGLFHEKVVVCESDYDCLFYQAIINAIYEKKGEISPDILYTHCGGKCRIKDVVKALKAVNVPVVAISDFDLLNDKRTFKALITAFGEDWENNLEENMKIIYDHMNGKQNYIKEPWKEIKKTGKCGFSADAPVAYEEVEKVCKKNGLFIVPVGEIECFDKTIRKEKKEWVYDVLSNYNLSEEEKLNEARKFAKLIADFKIS